MTSGTEFGPTREPWTLREPCKGCGSTEGVLSPRNGQDTVFCAGCRAYQYNASRVETGRAPRSVSTVHRAIRPKQRIRVLERSSGRCELCGAQRALHVAHLLSIVDGLAAGLTDSEINCDENLCALCEECNLGLGALSVSPRLYIALLRRRAM